MNNKTIQFIIGVATICLFLSSCYIPYVGWRASRMEIDYDFKLVEEYLHPEFSLSMVDEALYREIMPGGVAALDAIEGGNLGLSYGNEIYALPAALGFVESRGDPYDAFVHSHSLLSSYGHYPTRNPDEEDRPASWADLPPKRCDFGGYLYLKDDDRIIRLDCAQEGDGEAGTGGVLSSKYIWLAVPDAGRVRALVGFICYLEQVPPMEPLRAMRTVTYEVIIDPKAGIVVSAKKWKRLTARADDETWIEYLSTE